MQSQLHTKTKNVENMKFLLVPLNDIVFFCKIDSKILRLSVRGQENVKRFNRKKYHCDGD